jgi:hypothetical protein
MPLIYAIVNGNRPAGRQLDARLLGCSAVLLCLFLWIESHVRAPLVPLRLFRIRNFSTANVVGVLWAAAMFAWFFLAALYMQFVLGYSPLQIGLAFLPSSLIMAVFSIGLSAKLVMRYGISRPLAAGLGLATVGLALFIRLPVDGSFVADVLPSMILLGFGAGMAFNPVLLAAMNDVDQTEAGLASGIVNTAFMMGGALGLAVLASVAVSRTSSLAASGESHLAALTGGYHLAFLVGRSLPGSLPSASCFFRAGAGQRASRLTQACGGEAVELLSELNRAEAEPTEGAGGREHEHDSTRGDQDVAGRRRLAAPSPASPSVD